MLRPFPAIRLFRDIARGRQSIRHAAELNGVADRVDVRGEADAAELKQVIDQCPGPAAVLIDIEGAEFAFLTDEVIDSLASCHVIIELHDWLTKDGAALRDSLMDRLSGRFRSHLVHTGARDLSNFPELADLPDSERWLVCDEGRGRSMERCSSNRSPDDSIYDSLSFCGPATSWYGIV